MSALYYRWINQLVHDQYQKERDNKKKQEIINKIKKHLNK